jgi:hypothetical protein
MWISSLKLQKQIALARTTFSNASNEHFGIGFNGFNQNDVHIAAKYNNPNCVAGSGWQINDISQNIMDNNFHLVVGTINGNTMKLYIDGVLANTLVTPFQQTSSCWGGDIQIGRNWQTFTDYFQGKIDDIGIWNRALTPEEIQQLYTGSTVNPNEFTLYLDTIPGINGQQVLMPIRVKNFNNMLSAQFSLQFDPSVISYAGFANAGIPSITGSSFGQAQINNGVLTFAWSQPNITPVSLADDALLVNLRFNVIGAGGSFSPITFINSPTPIEFVDQTFVPLSSYQTLPGRVDVLNLAAISGNLKTENGNGIRSATVAATGFTSESTQSNLAGQYSLLLPQGQSYTITPTKGNDTLVNNGITTLDVLLIQRHILGILPLNSPYKIIAADVNLSGTVTSADINLINALILANISAYPSGRFWSFVPDNHVFSNPQNPFPFPAARTYNSLNTATNQDFFGMKLGDVNNSYNPALARRARSENPVELYIENQNVSEEATIQVPVRVKNFTDIAGFQFGLQWDASVLRYIEINPANGGLDVNKGENMTAEGKLNINWTEPDAGVSTLEDDGILFNISFEVLGGVGSNTNVDIYSSPTTPVEIYTGELEVADHSLQGGVISVTTPSSILEVVGSGIEITAYPNPFKDFTTLSIQSEVPRMAKLEIYDISGRLIISERITLQQGNTLHQVKVSHASGNYLIVLSDASNGNRLATMKLVKE